MTAFALLTAACAVDGDTASPEPTGVDADTTLHFRSGNVTFA